MTHVDQLNFGIARCNSDDSLPHAVCNCLIVDDGEKYILIDAGLGTREIDMLCTLSQKASEIHGLPIDSSLPAARQLPKRGYQVHKVTDIVLTHLDLDHTGGLRDFPKARVYLSIEEYEGRHNLRYLQEQFEHRPEWRPALPGNETWFGLEARSLPISSEVDIKLIPLPGHTLGHCGVAVRPKQGRAQWIFHVGDAYYNRSELLLRESPAKALSESTATDKLRRLQSIAKIRRLLSQYKKEIMVVASHDQKNINVR